MSTPLGFRGLTDELRQRVYDFMYPIGDPHCTHLGTHTVLPSLAFVPHLRDEFLSFYVQKHSYDLDLCYHHDREETAPHLAIHDHSIARNATEFHIYVNDDPNDLYRDADAALRFALGGRLVQWDTPSSGDVLQGNVHVVFDSLRGSMPISREHAREIGASSSHWRLHNRQVAEKIAVAINRILASHGPLSPPRITAGELVQLVCLLDDIHSIKLGGFGDGMDWDLDRRHFDAGAAADF